MKNNLILFIYLTYYVNIVMLTHEVKMLLFCEKIFHILQTLEKEFTASYSTAILCGVNIKIAPGL